MLCPKCNQHMFEDHFGFPESTMELWRCSNAACDYTFEMRANTRGFSFAFEQERDLDYSRPQAAPRFNSGGFPNQVFGAFEPARAPFRGEGA